MPDTRASKEMLACVDWLDAFESALEARLGWREMGEWSWSTRMGVFDVEHERRPIRFLLEHRLTPKYAEYSGFMFSAYSVMKKEFANSHKAGNVVAHATGATVKGLGVGGDLPSWYPHSPFVVVDLARDEPYDVYWDAWVKLTEACPKCRGVEDDD